MILALIITIVMFLVTIFDHILIDFLDGIPWFPAVDSTSKTLSLAVIIFTLFLLRSILTRQANRVLNQHKLQHFASKEQYHHYNRLRFRRARIVALLMRVVLIYYFVTFFNFYEYKSLTAYLNYLENAGLIDTNPMIFLAIIPTYLVYLSVIPTWHFFMRPERMILGSYRLKRDYCPHCEVGDNDLRILFKKNVTFETTYHPEQIRIYRDINYDEYITGTVTNLRSRRRTEHHETKIETTSRNEYYLCLNCGSEELVQKNKNYTQKLVNTDYGDWTYD